MNHEALWVEVYNYRDASGERVYADLALFALSLLSLTLSNADVERVFSQVNIIKSKTCNRIISSTLSGILHVRYGMKRQGMYVARLRNDLYCVEWGVKLYSNQPALNLLQPVTLKRFNDNMYRDICGDSNDCDILELTID